MVWNFERLFFNPIIGFGVIGGGRLEAELKLVLIIFRGYKMYLNKDNKIKLRIVSNIFIFKLVAVKFCRVSIDYEQKPVPASQPELIQK